MCRVDERIYVRADGHRSKFQDQSFCNKAKRRGKMCSEVDVRTTEYPDPTSSPVTSSPITPSYNTRPRRPSVSSRPSTRDGPIKSLKPGIHIDFNVSKGKPHVSITTGKGKRESGGSTSAYESAGSDASHTIRTGLPDISPPSLSQNHGGHRPKSGHYRNPSSDESFTGSGNVAHVYHASSDYDTPSLATGTTASSSGTRPVIHNGQHNVPSPSNTTLGQAGGPYRTAEVTPRGLHNDGTEGNHRSSSSYAPEIIGRDEDRQRRREEQKRQQEANDRELAANLMREENNKHVRFEKDRGKEINYAVHEQRRAEERERARQQERKDREAQEARDAAQKRSKQVPTSKSTRRASASLSSAQAAEQQRLVAADELHMRQERLRAEAIEREEKMQQRPSYQERVPTSLQERQQDTRHYDPRTTSAVPPVTRRNSVSNQAPSLQRSNSKRSTAVPQPREDRRQPRQPPISFYNNPSARPELPQAREQQRRPSSSHGSRPFMPSASTADPWDVRNMTQTLPQQQHAQAPLPNARGPGVGHNFPSPQHGNLAPQQATHRMTQAFYSGEYETDSDEDLYGGRARR